LVNLFWEKGCHFISLKEGWNFNLGTAMGNMQLHLFGMLAQYECDLIAERTREGLRAAAKKGRFPGRLQTDSDKVKYARFLLEQGKMTMQEIAEKAGVSRMTLYRKLKGGQS
jgi:DNA invertase Pin-like site-specific DNA recombinase